MAIKPGIYLYYNRKFEVKLYCLEACFLLIRKYESCGKFLKFTQHASSYFHVSWWIPRKPLGSIPASLWDRSQ